MHFSETALSDGFTLFRVEQREGQQAEFDGILDGITILQRDMMEFISQKDFSAKICFLLKIRILGDKTRCTKKDFFLPTDEKVQRVEISMAG